MTINDRVKEVRGHSKLSMRPFGEKIGMSATNVSRMEKGERVVTDRTIKLICSEFNINEDWLRTGKGEMFALEDEKDRTIKLAASIAKSDEKTREAFEILCNLEEPFLSIARDMLLSLKKHSNE